MSLTGCTQEVAEQTLRECNGDVIDAVDKLIKTPPTLGAPKKKSITETQQFFMKMRHDMEGMDRLHDTKLMKKDQHDYSSSQELSHTHDHLREEPSLDSHHTLQNQIEVPELEEQIQETVCPSQSE
jgi:hypothetical protein